MSMIQRAAGARRHQARRHADRGHLGQHRHRAGDGRGDQGYRMVLIMPEDLSIERAQTMKAFGAELILTPKSGGMEYARDLAEQMQREGKGRVLDQFANADNPRIHYETTGPEIWADTEGSITHFVSAMGTTGTITGVSRYLKEKNPAMRIIGAQPTEGSRIPGIRKWPQAYLPKIYDPTHVDELVLREPGRRRGHGAPPGARRGHLRRHLGRRRLLGGAARSRKRCENATIVFIVCDRGDRYLSTGVFPGLNGRAMAVAYTLSARNCATPLQLARRSEEDGGPKERAALPGLRLHALEQPDAGAGRRDRMPTATARCCWRATPPGRASMFALITGFMEAGETPQEGIAREVAEETSLHGRRARPDRRLRLPAHEPGHHRLPRGGARRGAAVARTGRVPAVRARDVQVLAAPAPATRWPTGCARAGTSRSSSSCRRGRALLEFALTPRNRHGRPQRNRHPRPELPAAHPEGQEGAGRHGQRRGAARWWPPTRGSMRDFQAFARQTGNELVEQTQRGRRVHPRPAAALSARGDRAGSEFRAPCRYSRKPGPSCGCASASSTLACRKPSLLPQS